MSLRMRKQQQQLETILENALTTTRTIKAEAQVISCLLFGQFPFSTSSHDSYKVYGHVKYVLVALFKVAKRNDCPCQTVDEGINKTWTILHLLKVILWMSLEKHLKMGKSQLQKVLCCFINSNMQSGQNHGSWFLKVRRLRAQLLTTQCDRVLWGGQSHKMF